MDLREIAAPERLLEKRAALNRGKVRLPGLRADFDEILATPKFVYTPGEFLSGPQGKGKGISLKSAEAFANEPHRATKAFLHEHRDLFGYGPEVLENARVQREFVTAHNGLKTVVWQQELHGIPVFGGVLISHSTAREELVNIASQMVVVQENYRIGDEVRHGRTQPEKSENNSSCTCW